MQFYQTILLKDGRTSVLRNGTASDGESALRFFILSHTQTDYLLSYPDEITFSSEEEAQYLQKKTESKKEIEILAVADEKIVGTAGIEALGDHEKMSHRCGFGISVDEEYRGLGIGTALLNACICCAKEAAYEQMELEVVSENKRAVEMYRKAGFVEYGRNPRGFKSRLTGFQELIYMRLEL